MGRLQRWEPPASDWNVRPLEPHSCPPKADLLSFFFFFLMIRPPPISTLFPYPTLFRSGSLRVPTAPGLGVRLAREALARLHDNYLHCGIRNRDDLGQMRKYDPAFTGHQPRF